jgi:hypothetical protein
MVCVEAVVPIFDTMEEVCSHFSCVSARAEVCYEFGSDVLL